MRNAILTVSCLILVSSCEKFNLSTALSNSTTTSNVTIISQPFANYSATATDVYNSSVSSSGGQLYAPRYVLSTNGDSYGTISYSSGSMTFDRIEVPGACTDSSVAPNCPFTWGGGSTGAYHGGDYNFFPNAAPLTNPFNTLKFVSADVTQKLLTGDFAGGMSDCGLDIGFGSGAGIVGQAPSASTNLQIAGRSTNMDMVKFLHRQMDAGTEEFLIDAPINTATDNSINPWGISVWSTSFNMTKDASLSTNGDSVSFHMTITFDHVAHTAQIDLVPFATNKSISLMHAQSITWAYTADPLAVAGSDARGGISFGVGANPLTVTQLESSLASIGFASNGVSKLCGYSNVILGLVPAPTN